MYSVWRGKVVFQYAAHTASHLRSCCLSSQVWAITLSHISISLSIYKQPGTGVPIISEFVESGSGVQGYPWLSSERRAT